MKRFLILAVVLFSLGFLIFSPKVALGAAQCPGGDCRNVDCDSPCIKFPTGSGMNPGCTCVTPTPTPPQAGTTAPPNPCPSPEDFTWTALGCLPNDPRNFVIWFLGRAIGIGGGIAFLLMIFGGFQVLTSAGNPERLNAGKEVIGSAMTGLLLIIFSLFILELIGVDILGLGNVGFKFGVP